MLAFAEWLSNTGPSLALRERDWLIPLLQAFHILAIAAVISSVLMIGLRILQVHTAQSIAATASRFMPWIWSGLLALLASGTVLIVAEPQRALPNPAFQVKMVLLLLALGATSVLQVLMVRRPQTLEAGRRSAIGVALVAVTFLLFCAIAFAGRFIAYLQTA